MMMLDEDARALPPGTIVQLDPVLEWDDPGMGTVIASGIGSDSEHLILWAIIPRVWDFKYTLSNYSYRDRNRQLCTWDRNHIIPLAW